MRTRGRQNQARRVRLVIGQPCVLCRAPATVLDHRLPLSQGGSDELDSNLQPICQPCHDRKTAGERRGKVVIRHESHPGG